jgi:hypothetical protein
MERAGSIVNEKNPGVKTSRKRKIEDSAQESVKKTRTTKKDKFSNAKIPKTRKEIDENESDMVDSNAFELWDESQMLSQNMKVPQTLAKSFIALLEEGCTLPFIARYRKAAVDNLMPDK